MQLKRSLASKIADSVQFLRSDIWRLKASRLSPRQVYGITQLRIVLLAVRRFIEDKCSLRASALTFYSLFSIVPVAAMAFAVAKGFGVERVLAEQLMAKLQGHEEVAERIIGFAQSMLEDTKGGAIAGVGIAVLFWTVVKLLSNIETSFNDIWGVKKARTFTRKLADFLSVMMICPILLIVASSISVLVITQLTAIVERLSFLGYIANLIVLFLKILPYALIWLLFTFIYLFMPNTKVQFKSALWGGIIGGTIYQLVQLAYITFQVGVAKYGAIYGSFAALPLFLAWLQLSWLIVLFGAEIAFAYQNVASFEGEADASTVSHKFKRLTALMIVHLCVKNFLRAESPPTTADIARELDVPIPLVRPLLTELTESRLLSAVYLDRSDEIAYQPACDLDSLTITAIMDRLDHRGVDSITLAESTVHNQLQDSLSQLRKMNEQSPVNLKLRDL